MVVKAYYSIHMCPCKISCSETAKLLQYFSYPNNLCNIKDGAQKYSENVWS
jgi:hypothetical protein